MSKEPFTYDPTDPLSHAELMRRAHEMRAEVVRDGLIAMARWVRARFAARGTAANVGRAA
ncbi:MAG: hypothetical protein JJU40_12760 [Rhodobacteraceae bacterium]|nr:hypothetical protein [Paracoccaceae bacterium]